LRLADGGVDDQAIRKAGAVWWHSVQEQRSRAYGGMDVAEQLTLTLREIL